MSVEYIEREQLHGDQITRDWWRIDGEEYATTSCGTVLDSDGYPVEWDDAGRIWQATAEDAPRPHWRVTVRNTMLPERYGSKAEAIAAVPECGGDETDSTVVAIYADVAGDACAAVWPVAGASYTD
jgi:hypothetical protein